MTALTINLQTILSTLQLLTFSNRLALAKISTPPDLIQLVPNLHMLSRTAIIVIIFSYISAIQYSLELSL